MNEQEEIVAEVFENLKKQDRKDDFIKFLGELGQCNSTEQIRALADWYLSKPVVVN